MMHDLYDILMRKYLQKLFLQCCHSMVDGCSVFVYFSGWCLCDFAWYLVSQVVIKQTCLHVCVMAWNVCVVNNVGVVAR